MTRGEQTAAMHVRVESRMRRRVRIPTAALLAVALLAAIAPLGCSVASLPSERAGITGTITTIVPGDGRPASFEVEAADTSMTTPVSDKAVVNIPTSTQFFDAKGTPATLAAVGRIHTGSQVRVWFEGAVTQSYPVQGSAKVVQILGE